MTDKVYKHNGKTPEHILNPTESNLISLFKERNNVKQTQTGLVSPVGFEPTLQPL